MFQNTQQLAEKETYETVYHGTSVYAICYMADKESRGQSMKQIKGKLIQYSNWLICYCVLLRLGRRPVIATRDKRPAFTVLGDHDSKQFRGELIDYHHSKGNIKMFNDVNFSCSFSNDSQICMPRKAYKWTMIFLKIILLSFPGQRAELTDIVSLFALKGSSGDNSFHLSMEYGQFPFLSTSVSQDNLFQERSHSQSK